MVLCSYFINGHCRFGSKCVNDHIDLKTLLKSEVEAAVNGHQWLLSCFGPFKESTVIPNLMDRSFEEVRLDFLEASKTGQAQHHVSELISQYNDALTKLNQLKMAAPDTIQLVANIYNQSVQDQKSPQSPNAQSNVFGTNAPAQQQQQQQSNPFQLGNVFGGSQAPQPTAMNAGSIFGGSSVANNPFQQSSTNSMFGGAKDQQQSVFGSTAQSAPQNSMFGSSQPSQQMSGGSIFGGGQTNAFGSSAAFTSPLQQQQQQSSANSIFGGSTFGQTQQAPAASIFGSSHQQPPSAGGIFGASQPQQPTGGGIFGSVQPQAGIFGSMQTQPQSAAPTAGIFGSVQTQMSSSNVFGAQQQTTAAPQTQPFAQQAGGNIFGGFQAQPEQNQTQNIFTQQAAVPPQNVFGIQQTPPIQQPPTQTGSIFQIQQTNQNPQHSAFGSNPFQTQPPQVDESAYSKLEDLTPEELAEFQAERFTPGRIPLKPPPKSLCF